MQNAFSPIYQHAAIYVRKATREVLQRFLNGDLRVLIVCGKLLEGFDHSNVSVVGIFRNVGLNTRVVFSQFIGRAVRKSTPDDPVTATILSHIKFNQRANYDQLDVLPDDDSQEDDEEEDDEEDDMEDV